MKNNTNYTKKEYVYVARNYSRLGAEGVSERLGRSLGSVSVAVSKLRRAGVRIEKPVRSEFLSAVKLLTK